MYRPPAVYFERDAFLVMIMAAIETGKKECLGWLFGRKPTQKRKRFTVTFTYPLQSVKRRANSHVEQSDLGNKRLNALMKAAPNAYPLVGDFHSHPEWGPSKGSDEMSDADIKNMDDGEISIVIAVSPSVGVPSRWRTLPDGCIRGSKSGRSFSIKAYVPAIGDKGRIPLQLRIVAPSALRMLNRKVK